MVEKSHTAGSRPSLYEPLKRFGEKIADWFAPLSEASAREGRYDITLELPGVKAEDIDVSVHEGHLTIKGEKRSEREEKGRTYFFSEREYGFNFYECQARLKHLMKFKSGFFLKSSRGQSIHRDPVP